MRMVGLSLYIIYNHESLVGCPHFCQPPLLRGGDSRDHRHGVSALNTQKMSANP